MRVARGVRQEVEGAGGDGGELGAAGAEGEAAAVGVVRGGHGGVGGGCRRMQAEHGMWLHIWLHRIRRSQFEHYRMMAEESEERADARRPDVRGAAVAQQLARGPCGPFSATSKDFSATSKDFSALPALAIGESG